MVKAYDNDLRDKLINYLLRGHNYSEASKVYGVSVSAIGRWMRRYKSEGHFLPRKNKGKAPRISKAEFERYIDSNSDKTLSQMGKYFDMTGVGIYYYMKKFGFSYKKKSQNIKKQTKKSE